MSRALLAKQALKIVRPLKVLVPLIRHQLGVADAAAFTASAEYYRAAGEMLLEAREQLSGSSWTSWLTRNFRLSRTTASRYMKLAESVSKDRITRDTTLLDAIGESVGPAARRIRKLRKIINDLDVEDLGQERQARQDEVQLHRELAVTLIETGYRALAMRLLPDRGGSKVAMARLNRVRHDLIDIAHTRRFV